MTLTLSPTLRSHWITFTHSYEVEKEEIFLEYPERWRGQDVVVTMQADRYRGGMDRDHQTLGSWRIYATDARPVQKEGDFRPAPLTDLARSKLSTKLRPIVQEFLDSEEYEFSRKRATTGAVRKIAYELTRYYGSKPLTDAIQKHFADMNGETRGALVAAGRAYDEYVAALERLPV